MPTLIIHGKSDPLINLSHGQKCAEIIPGAKSLWIDKMGHDLPPEFTNQVLDSIFALITRIDIPINP